MSSKDQNSNSIETAHHLPVAKEWLQSLIQKEYKTSARINSYECKEIGDQKGYLSVVSKVDLEYSGVNDQECLPPALIIKVPTTDKMKIMIEKSPHLAEFFDLSMVERLHNNEVNAYRFLLANQPPPFPIARCLHVEEMSKDQSGMIICEFIRGRSVTFNENYTLEQIDDLTKHIAAFHAYCLKHDIASAFKPLDGCFWGPAIKHLKDSLKKLRTDFPEHIDYPDENIDRAVEKMKANMYKLTSPEKLGYPPVVAFGDSQPNNIIFKWKQDGEILGNEVAAFLDFQLFHLGSCVYDLSAVVFWGVSALDFEATVERVLNLYHTTLCHHSTGNNPLMSFEELKKQFFEIYPLYLSMFMPFMANIKEMKDVVGFSDERIVDFANRVKIVYEV